MMLQGMTVEYLIRRTYPVKAGQTVLLHAAAGGVGLIACQWLKHLGATVIGTVGSAGEDGARQGPWLRPCASTIAQGRHRQARARADRRQGRAGGL